jgi:hypothetical protein
MFTVINSIQTKKLKVKASTSLLKETNVEFDSNKIKLNKYSIYDYLDDQEGKDANNSQKKVISLEKSSSMETINDVSIFKFYNCTGRPRIC